MTGREFVCSVLTLCWLTLPACRETPSGRRTPRPSAVTPATPPSEAPSARAQTSENALAGPRRELAVPEAPELIEVSGSQLIGRIKGSGKKAVILSAWASWCGPCRREMPMLVALKANLEPRGIGVEWVSVDEPSSRPHAVAFLREYGAPLPGYVAEQPLGPFKVALNPGWPGMLPASFLFDESGALRYFWGGPVYENELLDVVEAFLAGTLVDGEARFGLAPGKVDQKGR